MLFHLLTLYMNSYRIGTEFGIGDRLIAKPYLTNLKLLLTTETAFRTFGAWTCAGYDPHPLTVWVIRALTPHADNRDEARSGRGRQ